MALLHPAEGGRGGELDISKDFCCILSNGFAILTGTISLEPAFVRLSTSRGKVLEEFQYSSICSVNEEEPPTTHSLIFNLNTHSFYVSHLLRKDKLLKLFQKLQVYKPDVRLPAEAMGYLSGQKLIDHLKNPQQHCNCPFHTQLQSMREREQGREREKQEEEEEGERERRWVEQHSQNGGHTVFNEHPPALEGDEEGEGDNSNTGGYFQQSLYNESNINNYQAPLSGAIASSGYAPFNQSNILTSSSYNHETRPARPLRQQYTPSQTREAPNPPPPSPSPAALPQDPSQQQLRDLCMLFPHMTEEALQRLLVENGHNFDDAISAVLGQDTLANAPSASGRGLESGEV